MNFGLIALIFLQLVMVGACFFAYSRFLTDKEGLKQGIASLERVTDLLSAKADNALKVAEGLEVTHYKALQVRQLALETEQGSTATKLHSYVESLTSLSGKLASREKVEKRAAALAEPAEPVEPSPRRGKQIADEEFLRMVEAGEIVLPEGGGATEPAPRPMKPSHFGKMVGGR